MCKILTITANSTHFCKANMTHKLANESQLNKLASGLIKYN